MDIFILVMLIAIGVHFLKAKDQRRRIGLLGSHLGQYQIEKLMETLTEGYLRALGEEDPLRREQIWNLLSSTEVALSDQFGRFAAAFANVAEPQARISKLPMALPFADQLFPVATFDVRKAFRIHAQGISQAAQNNTHQPIKTKAFILLAEVFLMQHTCHWFCKSKTIASARVLFRHKTSYEQVLAAVAPDTRRAYLALTAT